VPHIDADGLRMHVQELGLPGAPPVVMFHGLFTGNLAAWYFSAAPAVSRDHRVRLVDLRGHGLSERPATGYDEHSMVADAAAVTADLPPFAVVGHSYGALLALRLHLAHPGRVTALVLVDPPLGRADEDGRGTTARATSARWRTWDEGPTAQVQALLEETSILEDLDAERPIEDDELRAITAPTRFLFGRTSPWRDGADRVRHVRPDLRCDVLDGGHDLQLDAKAEVTATIIEHLAGPSVGPEDEDEPEEEVAYG
jgi:pimeloyl-ACP methyl ester carboxylesterase